MAERNAAAGYLSLGRQTTPNTPVRTNILTPYYKQSLETNLNLIADQPVYGNKFEVFQQLRAHRTHKGSVTVLAEPNTAMYWHDMLLPLLSTTGSGPYVRTFGMSNTIDPKFYTVDLNLVSQVIRWYGVGASKISRSWSNEEMQFDIDLSGIGSYIGREIASVAAQVITLTTTYDDTPTAGLVVGDLVAAKSADGSININSIVIASLTATTVTVTGTITGAAAGQMLVLRPDPALVLNLQTPFLYPRTEYRFAATAALAAPGTGVAVPLEPGTSLDIMHRFQNEDGEKRSGSFDPASLIHTTGIYAYKTKQFFDNPDVHKQFLAANNQAGTALYKSDGTVYSMQDIMNQFEITGYSTPTSFGDTIYQELEWGPEYGQTDGTGMSVVITNGLVTF